MRLRARVPVLLLLIGVLAVPRLEATEAPSLRVGESLVYDVKFGGLDVGSARMEVLGVEDVRGRAAWHTRLAIDGRVLGYAVRDVLESWIDVQSGASLRFVKNSAQGSTQRVRRYEILPEQGVYRRDDRPAQPTVTKPLDEAAFVYFLRNEPLQPGRRYDYPHFFMPDRNPVTVSVLRHEPVSVPAGRFDTVVLRPSFRTEGVFAEGGRAEIWLSNDDRRWMVQLVTHLKFGTLSLRLREARLGA